MMRNAISLLHERILQWLEDIEDLAAIFLRHNEPAIPHKQVVAELKAEGLLSNDPKG